MIAWIYLISCLATPTLAPTGAGPQDFPDAIYAELDWTRFTELPAARQPIDLEQPDLALLNAAVFFATNEQREANGLPALAFHPRLRDAADHHARAMARREFVSHTNIYERRFRTMGDRGQAYGVGTHAENVASSFLHQYRSGSTFIPQYTDEGMRYLDRSEREIPLHSYLSFGRSVVAQWMSSPGHRRNILNPQLASLGCAVHLPADAADSYTIPLAYCVQDFSWDRWEGPLANGE